MGSWHTFAASNEPDTAGQHRPGPQRPRRQGTLELADIVKGARILLHDGITDTPMLVVTDPSTDDAHLGLFVDVVCNFANYTPKQLANLEVAPVDLQRRSLADMGLVPYRGERVYWNQRYWCTTYVEPSAWSHPWPTP